MAWLWFLVVLVVGFVLYRIVKADLKPSRFCATCGHEGIPVSRVPGSFAIEAVLWLCFVVPGLIYTLWRVTNRHNVCPRCGGDNLLPVDSPVAIKLRKDLNP